MREHQQKGPGPRNAFERVIALVPASARRSGHATRSEREEGWQKTHDYIWRREIWGVLEEREVALLLPHVLSA